MFHHTLYYGLAKEAAIDVWSLGRGWQPVSGSKAQMVTIDFKGKTPKGITFVLKAGGNWYKTEDHKNFNFPTTEEGREELLKIWSKGGGGRGSGGGGRGGVLVRTLSGTELNEPGGADVSRYASCVRWPFDSPSSRQVG